MSIQSSQSEGMAVTLEEETTSSLLDYPLYPTNQLQSRGLRMQSSFDSPIGDSSSGELLREDELLATHRTLSVDDPDEKEEALDSFEMSETATGSRNDLEILSPIKLPSAELQLTKQTTTRGGTSDCRDFLTMDNHVVFLPSLKSKSGTDNDLNGSVSGDGVERSVKERKTRKVVEFAQFDDIENLKQKRTGSTGEAAIQAKIFAEIKKWVRLNLLINTFNLVLHSNKMCLLIGIPDDSWLL